MEYFLGYYSRCQVLLIHEKTRHQKLLCYCPFTISVTTTSYLIKGTGTRDLIWLKVVSLDRSWLVGLTEDLYKNLKCCFIFFINILKSLVVLAKFMPIANVNRIGFVN